MTWTEFFKILAIVGLILTVISFYAGRKTASRQEGVQDGTILTELGYLKSSMDDIKRRLDRQDDRDRDYVSRLTCVEESAKSAHKRIDQLHREG